MSIINKTYTKFLAIFPVVIIFISVLSNSKYNITYDENYSDTQNITQFFNQTNHDNFENSLIEFINKIHCSYSIIILYNNIKSNKNHAWFPEAKTLIVELPCFSNCN